MFVIWMFVVRMCARNFWVFGVCGRPMESGAKTPHSKTRSDFGGYVYARCVMVMREFVLRSAARAEALAGQARALPVCR
jgi:hypothetical protein